MASASPPKSKAKAKSSREKWKTYERKLAALIGAKRIPVLGREGPDLDHPQYLVEVKVRKDMPEWLTLGFSQLGASPNPENKIPVLGLVWTPGRGKRVRYFLITELDPEKGLDTHALVPGEDQS